MSRHEIGTVDEFPAERGTPVTVQGVRLAVFNLGGEFYAVGDNCPHKNLPLHLAGQPRFVGEEIAEKYGGGATRGDVDPDDRSIRCPWHYMEWDLETGCNEPSGKCIPTYPVTVEDDTVLVEL